MRHEKSNGRLRLRYGTYKQGVRKYFGNSKYIQLTEEQEVLRQFKLRLTVRDGSASVAVDGTRTFRFDTQGSTTSTVIMFTLGGSNYRDHRVKIFSSRICRRNAEHTSSREKRYTLSNFRWYPDGEPISYSFVNYSSSLGKLKHGGQVTVNLKHVYDRLDLTKS